MPVPKVTLRRVLASLLVLVGVVAIAVAGGIVWLLTADLRPWIEDYASKSIERRVTIGTLKIGWGNPLTLEITGLKVANAPWGSVPDMISIESLSAALDPWSITSGSGVLKYQKLVVVKPVIVLERDKDGRGNWKFGRPSTAPSGGFALIPKERNQFPTFLDFAMRDGMLIYKGVGSYRLRLDLSDVTVQSPGEDQRITILAQGAYNGTAVKLTADTDSFIALRDLSRLFGVNLATRTSSASLDFKGTMVDPLNFEGVEGPMTIDERQLSNLLKLLTAEIGINPPLLLAGAFKHGGDHWEMTKSTGKIATSAFEGDLFLDEGSRGGQDNLAAKLQFKQLDLNPILPVSDKASGAPAYFTAVSIRLDPNPGMNIDADIVAWLLNYAKIRLADFSIHLTTLPNSIKLSRLKMAFAGGAIDASGTAVSAPGGTHVQTRGLLTGADAAQLAAFVDALAGKLSGRVDGAFTMDMTGDTLGNALRAGRGHAVVGMVRGGVSRDLMEKLSTNLLNLFGNAKGTVEVACLLGIVDSRNGVAAISPLRIKSGAGTLFGGGHVDMLGKRLDITIQSESSTTDFFALDIPIRISGSFDNPSIDSQIGGSAAATRQMLINNNPTQNLPPELLTLAERNPCLH